MFAEGFNKLIRTIYKNEYLTVNEDGVKNEKGKTKKDKKKEKDGEVLRDFDLQRINVEFPPPSSLNVSNLSEQIRNSSDVISFVVETYMGERTEDEELKKYFKKRVTKEFVPSIDWNRYDKLYEEVLKSKNKDSLLTGSTDDEDSSGGSSW